MQGDVILLFFVLQHGKAVVSAKVTRNLTAHSVSLCDIFYCAPLVVADLKGYKAAVGKRRVIKLGDPLVKARSVIAAANEGYPRLEIYLGREGPVAFFGNVGRS